MNITKITKTGIYAPHTEFGRIVVNNVLASCHAEIGWESLAAVVAKMMHYTRKMCQFLNVASDPEEDVHLIYPLTAFLPLFK